MKTNLDRTISTEQEAQRYLTELYNNGEIYHPDENAHTIEWDTCSPTALERDKLNSLMTQVCEQLSDPAEYIFTLINN